MRKFLKEVVDSTLITNSGYLALIFFAIFFVDLIYLNLRDHLRLVYLNLKHHVSSINERICGFVLPDSNRPKNHSDLRKAVKLRFFGRGVSPDFDLNLVEVSSLDKLFYSLGNPVHYEFCFAVESSGVLFGRIIKKFQNIVEVLPYYSEDFTTLVFIDRYEIFGLLISKGRSFVVQVKNEIKINEPLTKVFLAHGLNKIPLLVGYLEYSKVASASLRGYFASKKHTPPRLKLLCL
ncbi:MAG: hypothetical protein NZO16_05185 [Deltaproteobacteria bacterium]|nr:hypothetical protein [Deltaproteobacteria bacterium]